MIKSSEDRRVQTVLNAFDTLFNRRDYTAAERFWSPRYIQHSAHMPPGRDGLFGLIKGLPATLRYENHIAAATGDFVILHGRFSGHGLPAAWVAAVGGAFLRTSKRGQGSGTVSLLLTSVRVWERARQRRSRKSLFSLRAGAISHALRYAHRIVRMQAFKAASLQVAQNSLVIRTIGAGLDPLERDMEVAKLHCGSRC